MKPEADQILNFSALQLLTRLSPQLPDSYAQGTASLIGFMMILSAQEYERGAEIRAAENSDMRALFKMFAPDVKDPSLRARLEAAAETKDASLRISALDAANYELRRLLIVLHEYADGQAHDGHEMARKIWALLKSLAGRRVLNLPAM